MTAELSILDLLERPLAADPDAELVYRDEARLTYRTLRERVHRLAGALREAGVRPGETVGVLEHDSPRYLEAFFAIPAMGAVLHTLNPRLSAEQVLYTIQHAEDAALVVHRDFLPVLDRVRGRLGSSLRVIVIGEPRERAPSAFVGEYEGLLRAASPAFPFERPAESAGATLFYTTGTTGPPKGVSFSHRQIVLHTLATAAHLAAQHHGSLRRGDVYLPLTPMFHVHAWGLPHVATFLGLKQVYPGRWTPQSVLALIEREGVTFTHCVPTVLHMLLDSPAEACAALEGLKVLVGGAPLPTALARRALARGIDVVAAYGMSESCPLLALGHLDPRDLDAHVDEQVPLRRRAGRALPLVALDVVDEALRPVERDGVSVGEVVAQAPWLTSSYHKDPRATDHLWRGGVLHTGDAASRDGRGFVAIADRLRDGIKVGGEWLSSLALEDAIGTHPAVAEVAVVAAPDARWGERPLALVVRREPVPLTAQDVTAHVRDCHARGLLPRHAVLLTARIVAGLDRTSVGKLDKRALRARYAAQVEEAS